MAMSTIMKIVSKGFDIMRRLAPGLALAGAICVQAACDGQDLASSPEEARNAHAALTPAPADQYIVVFKKGVVQQGVTGLAAPDIASTLGQQYGGAVLRTYQYALQGAAMTIPASRLAAMKADSRVAYIEPDQPGSVVSVETNPPNWGLDRIDQHNLPLDNSYTYPGQAGAGVHVYVLDSGIYAAHPEFALPGGGSRVIPGHNFQDNNNNPDDCMGHGTHVAGIVGSTTYGVAKLVTLHSEKVVDCSGNGVASTALAAVDYVTYNHSNPAVVNMSLRYPFTQALNDAVTASIAAGITYTIAAGNDYQDACLTSPRSTPNAITVAATDNTDTRPAFSDFGPCVDIFAPGVNILSTWIQPLLTAPDTGTSMAAPHVAGAAALYLGANPGSAPATVAAQLIAEATPNDVIGAGTGSPNLLLYTGAIGPATPCAGLCTNPTTFTINGSYQSGSIGTSAKCFATASALHGGNCGNFVSPRALTVNGTRMTCNNQNWATIPAERNGGYCVQTTAGNYSYAYFTAW